MDTENFVCPYCLDNKIVLTENNFRCSNVQCIRNEILSICDKPILLNFEKTIVGVDNFINHKGESEIVRKDNKILNFFKNIFFGTSVVTSDNINIISHDLTAINDPKILIVGGGTIGSGLKDFYRKFKKNITSFDIYYSKNIDFIADAHNIPIKENYFDLVIIQAVLEHVINPNKVVAECYRVLKPSGTIYAETPFMQQVHEGPYDFTRYTDSGHRYLFKNFGLINSGQTAGVGTSLVWAIGYFFSGLFRSRQIGRVFRVLFFWLRFFDGIIPNSYNVDGASGVFFYGYKSENLFSDIDLIKYYKGSQ